MAGYSAYGTMLKIGGTAGTALVNVTSVEGPGLSTEMVDVTAHDSAGSFREQVPTFLDGGEVTLRINYDPNAATHKNGPGGLLKFWKDKTRSAFAVIYPTTPPAVVGFSAYVTAFSGSAPFDGKLEANVTLKVDGDVTLPS